MASNKVQKDTDEIIVSVGDGGEIYIPDAKPATYPDRAPAGETRGPDFLSGEGPHQRGNANDGTGERTTGPNTGDPVEGPGSEGVGHEPTSYVSTDDYRPKK